MPNRIELEFFRGAQKAVSGITDDCVYPAEVLNGSSKDFRNISEIGQLEFSDPKLIRELLLQFMRVREIADRARHPATRAASRPRRYCGQVRGQYR